MSQIKTVSPKDPDSVEWFSIDFANYLRDGDEIDELVEVAIDEGGTGLMVVEDTPGKNGTVVSFKLSGGTLDKTYRVRARVTTTPSEETLDQSLNVAIATQ